MMGVVKELLKYVKILWYMVYKRLQTLYESFGYQQTYLAPTMGLQVTDSSHAFVKEWKAKSKI